VGFAADFIEIGKDRFKRDSKRPRLVIAAKAAIQKFLKLGFRPLSSLISPERWIPAKVAPE
jgi:hypothetical protein